MKPPKGKYITVLIVGVLLAGCQAVFNPYDDAFQCPATDEGTCTGIPEAYEQSVGELPAEKEHCSECRTDADQMKSRSLPSSSDSARQRYQQKRFERLHALISADTPPLVAPPEAARILVTAYTGEGNELFGFRYIYFFVTEPSWLLSTAREERGGWQ